LHCNANATATISYGPQIAGNISVINKPCAGTSTGSLEFTPVLSGNGSLTYLWSNEQTTQSITDITAGTYSVTVADSKNCQYEPSTTLTEYALPTASFGGTTSICEGESTILSISLTGTAPWNVIYTDGTTPEVINGINTSPYSFSVSPTDTTTYSITAVSDAHCNGTNFGATATVNVNPIPIVTLTTPDKICIDATPINLTGGSPYGGFYTGDGVTGIAFDPATAGLGAHTITYDYSDAYGCSSSATSSITVNESPIVSITTSGKTAYCMGETISTILNALPSDAASYQWQLNGSDILNETNQTYQAVSDGLYSVTAHTAEGCSSTGDIEIVVNAVPDVSISTPDRTEYCQGETINALLTALPGDASSYQWKLDGSEILNETSQTYQAIPGGIYTVTASNADGCASTSEIEIIVNATPDVSITTSDKTEYCQGETISALLTALPSDATTYQWRLSGSDILDATNQTYNATATGLYSVVASNALSCSSTGDIEIVENTVPVIDISLGVDTVKIFTNDQHIFDAGVGFSSYLWNDDSSDQTLTVEAGTLGPGDYTYWVEVSNASGCAVRDTAILNINWPTGIYTDVDWSTTIFPNPTKGEFKINLFDLKADRVDVTILSSVGIVVFKKEFTTNTSELHETVNLENSPRGVYLVKITDKKTVITRKIVLE